MIRQPNILDSEKLMIWFNKLIDEEWGIAEKEKMTIENETKWLNERLKSVKKGESIFLIQEENNEIIACASLERLKRYIDKHVAELSFGVLKGYENKTNELMEQAIEKSKEKKIKVLIYYILACNERFIDIMKGAGFNEVGKISNFYLKNGKYIDRVIMQKVL